MTQKRIQDFYVNLHDYQIGELLGSGTSANVYKAKNLKTNQMVALKVFKQNFHDDISKTQFMREIETMIIFDHPAILQLKGYSFPDKGTKETPTIATELMPHGSFLDVLIQESNNSPPAGWNPTKKLEAAFAVACGMMFIHNHNGIHRDLKPANILLDGNFGARISDFGLSKIENEDSMQSLIAGTPLWMAPELFEQVQYTNKVDVFAYAITLYQVCTGKIPYDGKKNPMQIAMFITSGERPDIPISVPYFYAKLITDCWEQDPNDRPTFDDIVYRMYKTDTVLSGVNVEQYKEYQKRLVQFYPPNPSQNAIRESQFIPNQAQIQKMIVNNGPEAQQNPFSQGFVNVPNQNQNQNQNPFNNQNQANLSYEPTALGSHQHKHHHKKKKSHIKELIYEGDVDAMYQYGMKLINKGRENKAAKYIITAANRNQLDALPVAARMYDEGKVVKQNHTQAAVYWKKAADAGNVEAMIHCGRILSNGIGVNINRQKALYYYKMAVDKNSPEAMLEMGRLLKQETNNKNSLQEAMNLFTQSAKLGNLDAYYEYGLMLEPLDKAHAVQVFESAAKKGHQKSIEKLKYLKDNQQYQIRPECNPQNIGELTILGNQMNYHQKSESNSQDDGDLAILDNYRDDLTILRTPNQQNAQQQMKPNLQSPFNQPNTKFQYNHQNSPQSPFNQPNSPFNQPSSQPPLVQGNQQSPFNQPNSQQPFCQPQQQMQQQQPFHQQMQQQQPFQQQFQVQAMPRPKFKDHAILLQNSRQPKQGSNPNLLQNPQDPLIPIHRSQSVENAISPVIDVFPQPPNMPPPPSSQNGLITKNNVANSDLINLKDLADAGDTEACYKLGCLLMDNPNPSLIELQNAAVYLRKAATTGNSDAQYRCGVILEKGLGYPPDPRKAVYFYKQAADQGHTEALYHFGMCLMTGLGVPSKSPENANKYFRAAADMGHLQSQLNLAYDYDNGIGFPNNTASQQQALHYYKLASAQNSTIALCNLGYMAQEGRGMPGCVPNLPMAAECYRKAAMLNDPIGMYNYAVILQNGYGVEKNVVEAARYYKLAADKGSSDAQSNYALLLSNQAGIPGITKDLETAKRYAKMAADQGNPTGELIYAQLLIILDNNKPEAIKYFKLAAEKGNQRAQKKLKELLNT